MRRKNILIQVGTLLLLGLSSAYFTWLVDRVTLSTWFQRGFVFVYFVIVSGVLLRLRGRYRARHVGGRIPAVYAGSAAAALLCVLLTAGTVIPDSRGAEVRISNVSQAAQSPGGEVWLISLELDGEQVPLSGLNVLDNAGWTYSGEADDYFCTAGADNRLILELPPHEEARLGLITSAWAGVAEVAYAGDSAQRLDLYDGAQQSAGLYTLDIEGETLPAAARIFAGLGALAALAFFFSWAGEIFWLYYGKREKKARTRASRGKICALAVCSFFVAAAVILQVAAQYSELWVMQRDSTVTFVNEGKDPAGKASEVWLAVSENGERLAPEDILVPDEESGWSIRDGYFLSTTPGTELTLPCRVPSDTVFTFCSHAFTGNVSIQWEGYEDHYNFYAEGSSTKSVDAPWVGVAEMSPDWFHIALLAVGGVAAWAALLWFLLRNHRSGWLVLYGLSWAAVVSVSASVGRLNGIFIGILAVSGCAMVWVRKRPERIEKYCRGPLLAAVIALTVYTTFALAGNGLFMMGTRMDLNSTTISYFGLLAVVLCPGIYLVIGIFDQLLVRSSRLYAVDDPQKILWAKGIFFSLITVVGLICSLGFYPANMSPDGVDHWLQAIGYNDLTSGHPVAYTLLVRLLSKIAETPYVYIVFQITMFAYVCCKWLGFLYQKGVPFKVLSLVSVVIALLPNNYMMLTLMSKNPLCAILNLWVLLQIVVFLDNPEKCVKGAGWNIQTAISLAALYLVRYNNFLAVGAACVIIIFMTCYYFRRIRWKALPSLAGALIIILLVTGPVYSCYEIRNTSTPPVAPLVSPLTGVAVNQLEIPEDIQAAMEEILPLEEWKNRYNPYNRDIFSWTKPRPNFKNRTLGQYMSIYLRTLALYPDIVIQDRLQATDLIWSVFQSRDSRGYNHRTLCGIYETMQREMLPEHLKDTEVNQNGLYFEKNAISTILLSLVRVCEDHPLLDMFVWRNGIYIILVAALGIVLSAKHRAKYLLAFIPTFAIWITLLLVMAWQIYNYIYFFPMAAVAFMSCACVMSGSDDIRKERRDSSDGTIGLLK